MAREKATITVDRSKVEAAKALLGTKSVSEAIDTALSRLIQSEQLRHDVAAYARTPLTKQELADVSVELDLDDQEVDYDALYGRRR